MCVKSHQPCKKKVTGYYCWNDFRSNKKERTEPHPDASNQRLLIYSGRTQESVQQMLDAAHKHAQDVELHALLQQSAHMPASSHPFRGFTILNADAVPRADVIEVRRMGLFPVSTDTRTHAHARMSARTHTHTHTHTLTLTYSHVQYICNVQSVGERAYVRRYIDTPNAPKVVKI